MNVKSISIRKQAMLPGAEAKPVIFYGNEGNSIQLQDRACKIGFDSRSREFRLEEIGDFSGLPFAGGFSLFFEQGLGTTYGRFRPVFDQNWGIFSLERVGSGLEATPPLLRSELPSKEEGDLIYAFDLEEGCIEIGMVNAFDDFLVVMSRHPGPGVGPGLRLGHQNGKR